MKKLFWNLVRFGLPAAIIIYQIVQAVNNDNFKKLLDQPKHWGLLVLAAIACFLATLVTIVRWHFLVRAIDLPLRLRDTLRLGFLGYMYNFAIPGGVGGDLVKAGFLAHEQPDRKTEAVLTVLVDRIVGLYGLFLVATTAILSSEMWHSESDSLRLVCRIVFWCTGISTIALVASTLPGFSQGPISRLLHRLPRVGPIIERLNRASRLYYHHWAVLPFAIFNTLVAQSLFAIAFWLIGKGVLSVSPSLAENFVIVPMAMITGVLPLAPNGLGTFELVVNLMYGQLLGPQMASMGTLVSLGVYRPITVLIAVVGAVIYFFSRKELKEVLHEVETDGLNSESAGTQSDPAPAQV